MRFLSTLFVISLLSIRCAEAQLTAPSDDALAALLADDLHQSETIPKLLPYLATKKALLLKWTEHPPAGVSDTNLFEGLADAFGRLKMEEAVPFLAHRIAYVRLYAWRNKATNTIRERMPYVKALIQIGPAAVPFLRKTYAEPLTADQRIMILYTIAEIHDHTNETKAFLELVRTDTERQLEFVNNGLDGR